MLKTTDKNQYNANLQAKIADLTGYLMQLQKSALRKCFDATKLDSTAQACIEVAKENGWVELAREMERDLETELTY